MYSINYVFYHLLFLTNDILCLDDSFTCFKAVLVELRPIKLIHNYAKRSKQILFVPCNHLFIYLSVIPLNSIIKTVIILVLKQ